jgi:predicted amidohydrolase YtcJ
MRSAVNRNPNSSGVRHLLTCTLGGCTLLGLGLVETVAAAAAEADLVLSNGQIHTPAGWARSLAVKSGVIVAVGDDAAVAPFRTPGTKVIDLQGATVVPGLHDMHVHPRGAGLAQAQCRFTQGSTPQQIVDTVKGCVARRSKGDWVVGGQWEGSAFAGRPMHRSTLDRVSPDNPVALVDISGHSLWVNSKALQLAGITRATENPASGTIERDAKGDPTGVLRESATRLVRSTIPSTSAAESAQALGWSLTTMLSYGITSFTDASMDAADLQAYATLADQGVLKQRVLGCIFWQEGHAYAAGGTPAEAIKYRNLYARDRFNPNCVKIVLDGVPTDGHTAAMVESYADAADPQDEHARGMMMVPVEALKAAVIDFDRRGLTVKMHAAGDAAVRAGLDAIEAARKANGFSGNLHNVAHNSFVQMNDIRRARDIAATFEMSPYIWYPNPIIPDIAAAVGDERMKRWTPVKDAIDSGALVVAGSDWSVVPSVSPWIAIETLVTRQKIGGGGETLGEGEKLSLEEAFELFTVNAARQMGNGNLTGSIEPGLLADVLVLDRNPFRIPVTQIHETRVTMALINGEVVYQSVGQ